MPFWRTSASRVRWSCAGAEERLTGTGSRGHAGLHEPRAVLPGNVVDGRTDIYSLGCVLYEMLVGEPPFTGPTPQVILARQLSTPAPSIRTVRGAIPDSVERAIHRALAKVPADRFATASSSPGRWSIHPALLCRADESRRPHSLLSCSLPV